MMKIRNIAVMVALAVVSVIAMIGCAETDSKFTVHFDLGDGSESVATEFGSHDEFVSYINEEPVREGYVFSGWYDSSELTNKLEYDSEMNYADWSLYAGWEYADGVVFTQEELMAAIESAESGDRISLADDTITLSLSSELVIDKDNITIKGIDGKLSKLVIERAGTWLGSNSNDNIMVQASGVTLCDFTIESELFGYSVMVGYGSGVTQTAGSAEDFTVDGFTASGVTFIKNYGETSGLAGLYFGDSYFSGEINVQDCEFSYTSLGICSRNIDGAVFNIDGCVWSGSGEAPSQANYFFAYSSGSYLGDYTGAVINFTDNYLSGKNADGYNFASGVENHYGDSITLNSSDNVVVVSSISERDGIVGDYDGTASIGKNSFYDGIMFSYAGESYSADELSKL